MATVDGTRIQGLLVSAYGHLPCAAYRLLDIDDGRAACRAINALAPEVTTGAGKNERSSFNLAFTARGLSRLGLSDAALLTFSVPFHEGMASVRRSRVLGDIDANAPASWNWGGPERGVDALLLAYAKDEAQLEQLLRQLGERMTGFSTVDTLSAGRQPDGREHFGFHDGIGQPVVDGSGREDHQKGRTGHATVLRTGEFILGFENVYGALTPVPVVDATTDPTGILPRQPEGSRAAFGANGSYLVFRQLEQRVAEFWQTVRDASAILYPNDPDGPTRLAAKIVGRWPSGASLVLHPAADPLAGSDKVTDANDFGYAATDPDGHACPLGAHIRRANPRDALGPDPTTARESANTHRLLRRGRSFGDRAADVYTPDGKARGLHFICLNADLERQFEFVQQTWVNNPVFAGLYGETDPLIAQDVGNGAFTIQTPLLRLRMVGLRQFVVVRGGGYFFLPGIDALRFLGSKGG